MGPSLPHILLRQGLLASQIWVAISVATTANIDRLAALTLGMPSSGQWPRSELNEQTRIRPFTERGKRQWVYRDLPHKRR
jgi:hypothetical protein